MAYASQDDIVTIYSQSALCVAEREDGEIDAEAVARALVSASSEIDAYIGARYSLPLAEPTDYLKQLCVDIAIYRVAASRDVLSEEHRTRYEDALTFLRGLAKGSVSLGRPAPVDPDTGEASSPRPIVTAGPPREFTREKMGGL